MAKRPQATYQIKIGLTGAKPPIWRRVLIADSASLPQVHRVIQIAMGWDDSHLHQFRAGDRYYGRPDPEYDSADMLDERRYQLGQLLKNEKDSIIYDYDFGDDWQHKVTLEKILPADPDVALPCCIKGKGACPPEDVGGIYGYYGVLEILADPTHPEHEEYKEWVGGDFDPQAFDLDEVNAHMREYCG